MSTARVRAACLVPLDLARCAVPGAPIKKSARDKGLKSIPKITPDLHGNVDYAIVEIVDCLTGVDTESLFI
jgi:hypothetical protein